MMPFHLAIPVTDLEKTRVFYVNVLGCEIGRFSDQWIDFNFFGHQLSAHLTPLTHEETACNEVDGKAVPVRHFGVVMPWQDWQELSERLQDLAVDFMIEPTIRFQGKTGEQATMFIRDPGGNALEFKSFKQVSLLFED